MHKNKKDSDISKSFFVGIPGLEPGITGPESVVLPITPYPNLFQQTAVENLSSSIAMQRYCFF